MPEIPLQHLLQHVIEPQNTVVLVFTCCTKSYSTKSLQNKSKKIRTSPNIIQAHAPRSFTLIFEVPSAPGEGRLGSQTCPHLTNILRWHRIGIWPSESQRHHQWHSVYIYIYNYIYTHTHYIPVVPHKAVAEVSKIGNLYERLVVVNQGWQSEATDGLKGGWGLFSFSLFLWLSTYLPIYVCIYLSIYLSLSLSFI